MVKTALQILMVMMLLLAAACGASKEELSPIDTKKATVTEGALASSSIQPEIPSVQADEKALVEVIDIVLCCNGEYRESYSLTTDAEKNLVQAAVFNYMIKSAAWEGVDIESIGMYIHIYEQRSNGEAAEYYVFEKDGQPCMQAGRDGMYSTISDEVYQTLYELAMGWHTPHTMKIVSGGESIYAVRHWIWSEEKNGLNADGMRLTPQQSESMVEYITLAKDFAPYINGEQQPGVVFRLYDEDFKEMEYPIPSGLVAWTYIGHAGPGRYIAVAEQGFKNEDGSSGYQYFFGLIVPEKSE
jgi:hypothetical protein